MSSELAAVDKTIVDNPPGALNPEEAGIVKTLLPVPSCTMRICPDCPALAFCSLPRVAEADIVLRAKLIPFERSTHTRAFAVCVPVPAEPAVIAEPPNVAETEMWPE